MTNLAKYPASTVQILGAEKALFRALKTKGNTPKYGLIFHSPFIGKASSRNKGRISRYLANKCSIASRIDCFADVQTSLFGEKLKEQVEERLEFDDKGTAPRRNVAVMQEVVEAMGGTSVNKKRKSSTDDDSNGGGKKQKKEKKAKEGKAFMCSFVRVNCKAFQRVSFEEKTSKRGKILHTRLTIYSSFSDGSLKSRGSYSESSSGSTTTRELLSSFSCEFDELFRL